jgi:hypothetical protein
MTDDRLEACLALAVVLGNESLMRIRGDLGQPRGVPASDWTEWLRQQKRTIEELLARIGPDAGDAMSELGQLNPAEVRWSLQSAQEFLRRLKGRLGNVPEEVAFRTGEAAGVLQRALEAVPEDRLQ